jgi:UPF0716 family protein affecting phage T7 exclusion
MSNVTTDKAAETLLAMLIEVAGIVIVVTVAGISDKLANLMLVFAIGLWLLFLIMHTEDVTKFSDVLSNIERGAKSGK